MAGTRQAQLRLSAGRPAPGVRGRSVADAESVFPPRRGERVRCRESGTPHHQAGASGEPLMKHGKRGFTLIELLVAISVMAIVAVLGWRGLDSIVRARVALNADLDHTRGLQLAFAQM